MDSENGKRQLVENAPREGVAQALKLVEENPSTPAQERRVPEGCVVRTLNFRDRNLIVGACRAYAQGEKGKYKGQFKLERVTKVLNFDETREYYEMINDSQAENLFKWQEARQAYVAFRMMKGGMMRVEEFAKQFPDLDLDACPEKPPVKQPELTKDEQRGRAREFYIPSKLDTFIMDAIQDYQWGSIGSEFVTELMEKFGIKEE